MSQQLFRELGPGVNCLQNLTHFRSLMKSSTLSKLPYSSTRLFTPLPGLEGPAAKATSTLSMRSAKDVGGLNLVASNFLDSRR